MKKSLIVLFVLSLSLALASTVFAVETPKLANTDCVKCHAQPPADIEAKGMAHKSEIGCQDCHNGHAPTVKNNIPECSQCHSGTSHFTLKNCLGCHRNPHTPKVITFGKEVTEPCLTCHSDQIKQLKAAPSKHSKLFCSTCHDVHAKIPECTQCHKPHGPEMVATDCKKCHQAHMPATVTYSNDAVVNKDCASCHKRANDLLTASAFKHKTLACTFCHTDKHKMVPACQSCHGKPHPDAVMSKFTTCGSCHSIAHDLYNFAPAAAKKAAPKAK